MPDLKSKFSFSFLKRSPRKNASQETPPPASAASDSHKRPDSVGSQDSVVVGRYRPPSQASDAVHDAVRATSSTTQSTVKPAPMPRVLTDEQRLAGNKAIHGLSDAARLKLGLSQRHAERLDQVITSADRSVEKRQNLGNRPRLAHPPSTQRSDVPDASPYANRAASKSTPNLHARRLPDPPTKATQLPGANASTASLPKSFQSLPSGKPLRPLPTPMSEKARGKQKATSPEL